MATTTTPSTTRSAVDASLWWDPFDALLSELEDASLSAVVSQSLEQKIKDNHFWFLETVSRFKVPSRESREALNSRTLKIGSRELEIKPELKDMALKFSSVLCLDEIQSYILVKRAVERNSAAAKDIHPQFLDLVILEYYTERQCLFKCTRQLFVLALYLGSLSEETSTVLEEAKGLISGGLESRLLSTFEVLSSSSYSERMDVDLYTLWAEETLIENNLILEILFLGYYESFCTCDASSWKRLFGFYEGIASGSYNFRKLEVSTGAVHSIYFAKIQLLVILIEALNLENLLQMIHDNVPFRQGSITFSEVDIQEMDRLVSSFGAFVANEAGPLILAWAVFLCLISSLPNKGEDSLLMEIDHIGYARQAFEASALSYFLEVLQGDALGNSDDYQTGYRSVIRTFVSAYIASYEINLQFDDKNLKLMLDILCNIYRGEESLCIQFWDKDSFIDGPVRCLLCNLEGEFPFRTVELLSLLSALSEGAWPSQCVFNFLNKAVGLSTPFEISSDSVVDAASKIVETRFPLHVAGVEGLVIPEKSRGHMSRMINKNIALVRWEYSESGVLFLLLRLSQQRYIENADEIITILDLLSRLVTFNEAVCYYLMKTWNSLHDEITTIRNQEKRMRVDVVEIICTLIKYLSPSASGAKMMSLGVNILTKMLKCLPSHVAALAMKSNIFDFASRTSPFDTSSNSLSSGSWLLSGRLAKMLLNDYEQNDCSMTLSVLDFATKILETGLETDTVLALITFSVQYVLVDHEFWKYKVKHSRWKVTVKVLEVVKKCIWSISCSQRFGELIRDLLLNDSSIHSALLRIVCTTRESLEQLHVSRLFDVLDIEGLQLAISSGLDVLVSMLSAFSEDSDALSVFHQSILSPMTKPVPVISAAISLASYSRDPKIMIGATKLLSQLFSLQSFTYKNTSFGLDDKEISTFRKSICVILNKQPPEDDDLVTAALQLLTSAARYQPAFLTAVTVDMECWNAQGLQSNSEHLTNKIEDVLSDPQDQDILLAVSQFINRSEDLFNSKPNILLHAMNLLRVLWEGAPQFTKILQHLKSTDQLWKQLTESVTLITSTQSNLSGKLTEEKLQSLEYRYRYLSDVLYIVDYQMFLQKKLLHAQLVVNRMSKSGGDGMGKGEDSTFIKDKSLSDLKKIISTWSDGPILSDLIKACASLEYDDKIFSRSKIATGLFAVHVMVKLKCGEPGSLSVALIDRITNLMQKMQKLSAFSELITQYAQRGHSAGKELENLILSDLFYHIQGELEGRQIDNRPFKELLLFLTDSELLDFYKSKHDDHLANTKTVFLYDTVRLRADTGLEMWDLLAWKESKEVAETMLLCLQDANSTVLLLSSKLSALRGLIALLYMHADSSTENDVSALLKISEHAVSSSTELVCQCLHSTVGSLSPFHGSGDDMLGILTAQVELLLLLVRNKTNRCSQPIMVSVLKTSGFGLKVLCDCSRSLVGTGPALKYTLLLIISSLELTRKMHSNEVTNTTSEEANDASLSLLPVLCRCLESSDHFALSLVAINTILKGFSTHATWLPIIQEHLPRQLIVQRLQDVTSSDTLTVILKFLVMIVRVRLGAELLVNAGILTSLKILLSNFYEEGTLAVVSNLSDQSARPLWGLHMAILTAIIQSLGEDSSSGIVDHVMGWILVERAPAVSYYLSAPDFPSDGREKKRARAFKSNISLSELKETENTLALICVLARYSNSWEKILQDVGAQLREKSIHLLAFISRATQRPGELLHARDAPLLCHPVVKEEFEQHKNPSFVNSRHGWFALAALGCKLDDKFASLSSSSSRAMALVSRSQSDDLVAHTQLSDEVAIEIYKIAFLLLRFLCIQAENAARKAEEIGFVDIAHFPELPMPEILQGLQDQGIVIVTELCEANKSKRLSPETEDLCLLLMNIAVMALYLEFCVIQICGIRPVLGYVETFSKEFRLLIRATENQAFLNEPLKSLKQIVSFVYPELTQAESLF